MKRIIPIVSIIGVLAYPAAAMAEPLLIKVQNTLAPLPRILFSASLVWLILSILYSLGALWRAIRGPRKEGQPTRREAAIRMSVRLVWGSAPALIFGFLVDTEHFILRGASIKVAGLWFLLFIPALLLAGKTIQRRLIRFGVMIVADIAGAALLLRYVVNENYTIHVPTLIIFLGLLHISAAVGFLARGVSRPATKWVVMFSLALASAIFLRTPAQSANLVEHNFGPVIEVPVVGGPIIDAAFHKSGESALVIFAGEPRRIFMVQLSNGKASPVFDSQMEILSTLALNDDRTLMAATTSRTNYRRTYLFHAYPFGQQGTYDYGADFQPLASAFSSDQIITAGEGKNANLRLCPIKEGTGVDSWPVAETCKDLALPLARVGHLLVAANRNLAIAAEGTDGFADGWQLVNIDLLGGNILRLEPIGRGVGGMVYDPDIYRFYLARPLDGRIEVRSVESLRAFHAIPAEKGVELLALDTKRKLMLATSRLTGNLIVIDLLKKKIVERIPIGTGIHTLDYWPETATALVGADRGLVTVKVMELPGLEGTMR